MLAACHMNQVLYEMALAPTQCHEYRVASELVHVVIGDLRVD